MGPEEELLYRAKCCDEEALFMLLEEVNKRVPKQLKAKLKVSYGDIEDAIMIAFEKFIENPFSVKAKSINGFIAWIKTVSYHTLIDQERSSRIEIEPLYHTDSAGNEYEIVLEVQDMEQTIIDIKQTEWIAAQMKEAIEELEEIDMVIMQKYIEGYELKKIALDLNISYDAIKQRKRRALQKLRKILMDKGLRIEDFI